MSNIITINFYNDEIIAIEKDSTIIVPIKRIIENLELDWDSQKKRIYRDSILSVSKVMATLETNAGPRETVCLPLKYMYSWLMKLNPSKVAPHILNNLLLLFRN